MFDVGQVSTLLIVVISGVSSAIICWFVWGRKLIAVERSLSSVGLVSGVRQRLLEHIDYERKVVSHNSSDVQDMIAMLRTQNEIASQECLQKMSHITECLDRLQDRLRT